VREQKEVRMQNAPQRREITKAHSGTPERQAHIAVMSGPHEVRRSDEPERVKGNDKPPPTLGQQRIALQPVFSARPRGARCIAALTAP